MTSKPDRVDRWFDQLSPVLRKIVFNLVIAATCLTAGLITLVDYFTGPTKLWVVVSFAVVMGIIAVINLWLVYKRIGQEERKEAIRGES